MRKEQTKVYVLMLSKEFPKEHPKAGEQTGFKEKLELALKAQEQAEECTTCGGDCKTCYCPSVSGIMKVHTIRTNMGRWHLTVKSDKPLSIYEIKAARYKFIPDDAYMTLVFPKRSEIEKFTSPNCMQMIEIQVTKNE